MNHSEIEIEELSAILSYIGYLNSKIQEGSEILGENFGNISKELMNLVDEAVVFEDYQTQPIKIKAA